MVRLNFRLKLPAKSPAVNDSSEKITRQLPIRLTPVSLKRCIGDIRLKQSEGNVVTFESEAISIDERTPGNVA